MGGSDDSLIPSVFVGYASGKEIMEHFTHVISPNVNVWIMDRSVLSFSERDTSPKVK